MAYYVAVLPVLYIGTQVAASKAVQAATNWFTICEEHNDDTAATIDTARSILNMYRNLNVKHPAYTSRLHLKASLDSLVYLSERAKKRAAKWRLMRKDFTHINSELDKQRIRVEQRIRLFREVTLLIKT